MIVIPKVLHQIIPDFAQDLLFGHVAGVGSDTPHPNPEVSTKHKLTDQGYLVKNRS